jgi:NAD(P)-dependent dehydrogenase (short-subunit alcohol dehydrogenase family)
MARGSVSGRTVLVTGAARGIGAEAARQLARRGANVSLVGLEPELLQKVAAECGPNAAVFEADVTDWDALERAVEGTVERFGEIYAVVANAGIGAAGTIRQIDPDAFERTMMVDFFGVWRTVRTCLPHIERSRGYVLTIASMAAISHLPGFGAYGSAKSGVEAFTNVLRIEEAQHGVDVGCAYFGWIDTDLVKGTDENPAGRILRQSMKGPLAKTLPVSSAGKAIALGVEKRCRIIVAPPIVRALLPVRGLLQRLAERQTRGLEARAEAAMDAEIAAKGIHEVSRPVGAGGAADAEASGYVEKT